MGTSHLSVLPATPLSGTFLILHEGSATERHQAGWRERTPGPAVGRPGGLGLVPVWREGPLGHGTSRPTGPPQCPALPLGARGQSWGWRQAAASAQAAWPPRSGTRPPRGLAPRVWTGRDHHDPERVHLAHEHCSPRARSRRPLTPGATSAALHTPSAEVGVTDLRGRLPRKVPPASDKHGRRT